jgi:predicted regulator of Ras-like GTPase activity (Roadblock/LC7/MglB family)
VSVGRDQDESAFATILADLIGRMPGARAAALVDTDGETVDYASHSDPFSVRLAAAHWRIVLREAQDRLGESCALTIRASRRSFMVTPLPEGYALIVALSCGAHSAPYGRALPMCLQRLAAEAGWPSAPLQWHPLDVLIDERARPVAIHSVQGPIEILGTVVSGLGRCERGWRIRCRDEEATVVREASGHWYTDEALLTVPSRPLHPTRPPPEQSR